MLIKFNKARIHCPVVVYEEISVVFLKGKTPKNDKKHKNFLSFYAIFVTFSIDFEDYIVGIVQHGTISLSSSLL